MAQTTTGAVEKNLEYSDKLHFFATYKNLRNL